MNKKRLSDAYKLHGFTPLQDISNHPEHPGVYVIKTKRVQKKLLVRVAGKVIKLIMTVRLKWFVTCPVEVFPYI